MKKPRLRALVLAAGHGSRLRPLTAFIPKPLLPVRGTAAVAHTIDQLVALGCEGIAINLFHRGEQIRKGLGESRDGVSLTYSIEEELRGTLGALAPLRDFLGRGEMILIVNGDSLCRWPLRSLLRRHRRSRADATLLVSKRIDPQAFGGGVEVADHKSVVGLRPTRTIDSENPRRVFMGAHVLSPRLLDKVPAEGAADFVVDLYEPLLAAGGSIAARETSRKWHDLGTPERYRRAVLDWGSRRSWQATDATVEAGSSVRGSVIEAGAAVQNESRVSASVVLSDARIGAGSRVVESIIGPGVDLPPHTTVQRRMVTPVRADARASENASVVGGLVYEPI